MQVQYSHFLEIRATAVVHEFEEFLNVIFAGKKSSDFCPHSREKKLTSRG